MSVVFAVINADVCRDIIINFVQWYTSWFKVFIFDNFNPLICFWNYQRIQKFTGCHNRLWSGDIGNPWRGSRDGGTWTSSIGGWGSNPFTVVCRGWHLDRHTFWPEDELSMIIWWVFVITFSHTWCSSPCVEVQFGQHQFFIWK
jgi:hypothetical protein